MAIWWRKQPAVDMLSPLVQLSDLWSHTLSYSLQVTQLTGQPAYRPTSLQVTQLTGHPACRTPSLQVTQLTGQPVHRPTSLQVTQLTGHPAYRPPSLQDTQLTGQPAYRPTSLQATQLTGHPVEKRPGNCCVWDQTVYDVTSQQIHDLIQAVNIKSVHVSHDYFSWWEQGFVLVEATVTQLL